MSVDTLKKFVQLLAGAVQSLRLYPRNHPLVGRQIAACLEFLQSELAQKGSLRLGLTDGTLFCDEFLFTEPSPALLELARLLNSLQVEGVDFQAGIAAAELEEFLVLASAGGWQAAGLEQTLSRRAIAHIIPLQKEEDAREPRAVFRRALKVVENIFNDVRLGRIPASRKARESVQEMVEVTLEKPQALLALSLIKDYDNYTFHHSVNVAVIAIAVGRACGVSAEELQILGLGGLLHDLGKLKINIDIINKPGRLTAEEFELIKKHPEHGASIAKQMEGIAPEAVDIVLGHHVHYNRKGYPHDLTGRQLSPLADMAAIADSYDAMTTLRSYRRPVSPRQAIRELKACSGTLLHPEFLDRFLAFLGPYPVGTVVRLAEGDIALVATVKDDGQRDLTLKVLFDGDGQPVRDRREIKLTDQEMDRIVGEIDPFLIGVNLNDHF